MHAWRDILRLSAEYLVQKGVPDAQVAAELLVARLLKCGRGFLSPHLDETPDAKYVEAMRRGIARLVAGEPDQYVLGEWDFRSLTLKCDRRALIPRPETEELVTRVLKFAKSYAAPRPFVVDVGTGSGWSTPPSPRTRARTRRWSVPSPFPARCSPPAARNSSAVSGTSGAARSRRRT